MANMKMRSRDGRDVPPTGGDMDANQYQASVSGEEAVGGLTPTPEQTVVDDLAASVGVEMEDDEPLEMLDKLNERDQNRWELDRSSAEDAV